jgi:CMP-N-acetylneuraminic acid synthetase
MRVLGLIPARGGSKGIPRKNVRPLGGRPLLAWTAETALAARGLARVVLSTEDAEIAEVGRTLGLDVPFMRPAALATDRTPMRDVVRHALRSLDEAGDEYDAVCLLQPTVPFRAPELVDACIARLEQVNADAVITVRRVPERYNPHWVYLEDEEELLALSTGAEAPIARRQDLPPAYHRDGSVYVIHRRVITEGASFLGRRVAGHVIDDEVAVNIDEPTDWVLAERVLASRRAVAVPTSERLPLGVYRAAGSAR